MSKGSDDYATLMNPNKDETAVHGCHCRGDMAARMRLVLAIPRTCDPMIPDGSFVNMLPTASGLMIMNENKTQPMNLRGAEL